MEPELHELTYRLSPNRTFDTAKKNGELGSKPPFAASLPNGGFGATAELCKLRFLRIADLDGWRSIVG